MKKIVGLLIVCLLSMTLAIPAFASDVRTGEVIDGSSNTSNGDASAVASGFPSSTYGEDVQSAVDGLTNEIAPYVSTEDIVGKIESKGNDIVTILQTVGKYVCIAAFIICCFLTLVGLIGNKRLLVGGILGLILSGVAYAGIVCGKEIVSWIATWTVS